MEMKIAKFSIGEVVRHQLFDFIGVIFDVDPVFANDEEWLDAIPKSLRPHKDQPFYHLMVVSGENSHVAYASEENLQIEKQKVPLNHPEIKTLFKSYENGRYLPKESFRH